MNESKIQTPPHNGLSTANIVIRIILVISFIEFLVMLFFSVIHLELDTFSEAILDAVLLSVFSAPFIYLLIIRPFILARDDAEAYVRHMALHDPLTNLPNRRMLDSHITNTMEQCVRNKVYAALILIDLDGFKLINDEFGHNAGDYVLIDVAEHLNSLLRQSDFAARLGGDEFVVLIHHAGTTIEDAVNNAKNLAEKLRKDIKHPLNYKDNLLNVDSSIGIRLIKPERKPVENILRDADTAMYAAKKAGRSCVRLFE